MTANYLILSIFAQSDELTWANRVINFQYNMIIWGIIVIIGLAALVAGASWFNYYRFSKQEFKHTINSLRLEMDTIKQELIIEIENELKKRSEETKKEILKLIKHELTDLNAEKARIFAIMADHIKRYNPATEWWSLAIEGYKKVGRDDFLRTSVEALIDSLNKCQQLTVKEIERIEKCLPSIPLVLDDEKNIIEERLTKLKDQVTK